MTTKKSIIQSDIFTNDIRRKAGKFIQVENL